MSPFSETYETVLRFGIFAAVFMIMALAEGVFPQKARNQKRTLRWSTNLGISVLSSVLLKILFPVAAVGAAVFAMENGYGLLNQLAFPYYWVFVITTIIVLDLAIYTQHVATHKFALLWALHKVHHVDRDIDASTGVRFHPVEILLSMLYKMLVIILFGADVFGVLAFEILLNASALFNHANIRMPRAMDRVLRLLIVTPDMHRVHHSVIKTETDSNYGFNFSFWDRLFGTYRAQPEKGHKNMKIGLPQYQSEKPANIIWSLALPFRQGC